MEKDPVRTRVATEKLKEISDPKAWKKFNYSVGVQRMRSEYFAFFGVENNLYEQISISWKEHEKCGLVILHDFMRVKDSQLTITKTSHNTEVFKIA